MCHSHIMFLPFSHPPYFTLKAMGNYPQVRVQTKLLVGSSQTMQEATNCSLSLSPSLTPSHSLQKINGKNTLWRMNRKRESEPHAAADSAGPLASALPQGLSPGPPRTRRSSRSPSILLGPRPSQGSAACTPALASSPLPREPLGRSQGSFRAVPFLSLGPCGQGCHHPGTA